MTPVIQEALVETFRLIERCGRKRPTNPQVFAIVRGMGHRFMDADAKALLGKFRSAPRRRSAAAPEAPISAPDAPLILSVSAPITPNSAPETPLLRTDSAGATCARVIPSPIPIPDPSTNSVKRAREAKPIPELPTSVRDDYERLVANDAAKRRGGVIADSVVAEDELTLRRAYEKFGTRALEHGVDIALRRGLGVRFAAGCVRNYDGRDDDPKPQLSLVAAGGIRSFAFQRAASGYRIPGTPYTPLDHELR